MATKYPIYPGMDLKFLVSTEFLDFHIEEDDFQIVIRNRWGQVKQIVHRDDCFWDTDGNFYFTMENVKKGEYFAYFMGTYEDEDYDKQKATVTDMQPLVTVPDCGCHSTPGPSPHRGGECCHKVHYQIVWTVSIDGDEYLAGSDGKYILTSDGKRICFKNDKRKQIEEMGKVILDTMTAEEFKQFIEGRNPDGKIDTLPEMLAAAQGISDTETIQDDVQQQIQDEAGATYEGDTRTLYINGAKPKPKE
jgi:tRNA U54 and U55 pseudouridine synthase Pus10